MGFRCCRVDDVKGALPPDAVPVDGHGDVGHRSLRTVKVPGIGMTPLLEPLRSIIYLIDTIVIHQDQPSSSSSGAQSRVCAVAGRSPGRRADVMIGVLRASMAADGRARESGFAS